MQVYSIFSNVGRTFVLGDKRQFHVDGEGIAFRRPLKQPPPEEQVEACVRFLSSCVPLKTRGVDGYGLKHIIEDAPDTYVCNGACIEAARRLGFPLFVIDDAVYIRRKAFNTYELEESGIGQFLERPLSRVAMNTEVNRHIFGGRRKHFAFVCQFPCPRVEDWRQSGGQVLKMPFR